MKKTLLLSFLFIFSLTFVYGQSDNDSKFTVSDSTMKANNLLKKTAMKKGYFIEKYTSSNCDKSILTDENSACELDYTKVGNIMKFRTVQELNCGVSKFYVWLELKNDSTLNILIDVDGSYMRCMCVYNVDIEVEVNPKIVEFGKIKFVEVNGIPQKFNP